MSNSKIVIPQRKKVFLILTDEGSATKSTIADLIISGYRNAGKTIAKFDGDIQHQTTFKKYGDGTDNPITGCVPFDIETDNQIILNSIGIDADAILIDLPARAVEITQNLFSDIETFYKAYEQFNCELNVVIPVVSDKSIISVNNIYNTVSSIDFEDTVRMLLIKNVGYMKFRNNLFEVNSLYEQAMKSITNKGNLVIVEHDIKTVYDSKGILEIQLKSADINTVINSKQDITTQVILGSIKNDIKQLHAKIS
ncbi:hypothetical protein SAMN05192566_0741 [Methylophilus rhizosphaerae]|uniref:CobQ/CobB/MinD/ParA nucleotide binding domain-containing protein n=1 Tax=Methylophilus rhizosphaerae TaxID=492660 RepID=A0A1G9A803_9PROT|nr:hypothetical protein [Methylophilus rhizosphaerae]SDK23512.1 hypothetical protein SAMN05192566_0741 [Methylophilus rhizosphaerae]